MSDNIRSIGFVPQINSLNLNRRTGDKKDNKDNRLKQDKQLYPLLNQLQSTITKIQNYDLNSISKLDSSVRNTKSKLNGLNKRMRAQKSMRHQKFLSPRFVDVLH